MNYFSTNLQLLRNQKGYTQVEFAETIGITRNMLIAYESNRAQPSIETLMLLSDFFKLPIDLLVKNDLSKASDLNFIKVGKHRIAFPMMVDRKNRDVIEVVTQKASAGYLSGYADSEYISDLPIMNLSFLPTGKHRAFPIKGDSMHPYVKHGDFVVGEYIESVEEVKHDDCYILLTKDEGLVYKRIDTSEIKKGYLILKSDNPIYAPYRIHLSEVLELWKFKLCLCIGQYKPDELHPSQILNLLKSFQIELREIKGKK